MCVCVCVYGFVCYCTAVTFETAWRTDRRARRGRGLTLREIVVEAGS